MPSTYNLNLDSSYTHDNIISIMNDIIGLYLVIKNSNSNNDSNSNINNRAKLTIKTILMSLCKQDIDNTFYKYYDLFKNILFKIKNDKVLNPEEINNREVAFALLTQIKLIIDSYWKNSDNIVNNNNIIVNNSNNDSSTNHINNDSVNNNNDVNNNNNNDITNNNTLKDIIEKGFSTLDNQNFYLFKDINNNEFITDINQIKDNNIKEFKLFCQNMIIDCSKELLEKYF